MLEKALPPSCVAAFGSPAGSPPCETGRNLALGKVGGILISKAKKNKYDAIKRDSEQGCGRETVPVALGLCNPGVTLEEELGRAAGGRHLRRPGALGFGGEGCIVRMPQTFLPVSVAFLLSCLQQPRRNFPVRFKWRRERWSLEHRGTSARRGGSVTRGCGVPGRVRPEGLAVVRAGDRRKRQRRSVCCRCKERCLESRFARVICLDCFVHKKQEAKYRTSR